ncbi:MULTISPECIES: diaminopimelate decarboxylase [Marichromatium]|uniref:Diaminopimelate decarboxylase n=1 Tax=Marichromatium gracile TaxID=1048 RepID=A0A4R4AKF6_MARGR|nr:MULTISPECIES: diaminopimelate decarboxylase [Marichromatium]MBK1710442.1 diaminopimelate decarboxylase [Marichromatium gracile]RNE92257.1 diaminopimelate decarboxylase [Marichromatium sp. AB31]RNE92642.1 diaminopimelate decarboxylase [Marichromatium sp. AB32]TCW39614.1 diaminopimelate decarboxylase [Marichromatium gracile]
MDHFNYRDDLLHAESVPLTEIAERFGTPCYIYSRATLERHWHAFDRAFGEHPHLVCFAVKANSNLAVLDTLARLGSGFDIVSVGELERVLAAGGDPSRVVFSGVGKRADEMRRALEVGIRCFNLESEAELDRLDQVAGELGVIAPVSLRVNPDVDARTHPYISTGLRENKFGIDIRTAEAVYRDAAARPNLRVTGIDCHIGSQLTDLAPFIDALDRVLALADRLAEAGIAIEHLDLGGGLGIRYRDELPPDPAAYAAAIRHRLAGKPYEILIEPGRAIAGNAGVLLTRVEYLKPTEARHFAIVDGAMNDLLRPALYQAEQEIVPVHLDPTLETQRYDLVGPVCETGDFLGKSRQLAIRPDDLLAVRGSGAYGFTMSSNYNSRPRAAEVMVDGDQAHLVRERESIESLFAGERRLP